MLYCIVLYWISLHFIVLYCIADALLSFETLCANLAVDTACMCSLSCSLVEDLSTFTLSLFATSDHVSAIVEPVSLQLSDESAEVVPGSARAYISVIGKCRTHLIYHTWHCHIGQCQSCLINNLWDYHITHVAIMLTMVKVRSLWGSRQH